MRQFTVTQHGWGLVVAPKTDNPRAYDPNAQYIAVNNDVRYPDKQWIEYVRAGFVQRHLGLVPKEDAPLLIIALMRRRMK